MSSVHDKIMAGEDTSLKQRKKLLTANWVQVIGSTVVFIWGSLFGRKVIFFTEVS